MTAQIASTMPAHRPMAENLRLANIFVDVSMTVGAAGVVPVSVQVVRGSVHGTDYDVDVQFLNDKDAVDKLAGYIPGTWDPGTDRAGYGNYGRRGACRFGGESVTLRVYTGRPTGGAL